MSAADDQHVAGLIMALEQSLVMGIGLAYLFARMLERVRGGGASARSATTAVAVSSRAVLDPARALDA